MIEATVIILFCLVLYWRTIWYSVVVDDLRWIDDNTSRMIAFDKHRIFGCLYDWIIQRLYGAGTFIWVGECDTCHGKRTIEGFVHDENRVREVPCIRCKGHGRAHHVNLRAEHAFAVFLHTAICVLIYFALGKNQVSFLAAMLYAANPANTQTSIWLNGRRYAINIILMLLTMLFAPWGLIFYVLTPMFQINAIFTPVLLGGWWFLLVPAVVAWKWKKFYGFFQERMKVIVNEDQKTWHWVRLITVIKSFGFYISRMVLPSKTLMIYPFLHNWGMTENGNRAAYAIDRYFWLGLTAITSITAGSFMFQGREVYWLVFLALATLQWCNFFTPVQTAADRYVSLANVFMMYFVARIMLFVLGPMYGLAGLAFLLGYYVHSLNTAKMMFRDISTFYDYHNFFYPENVTARKFQVNWKLKLRDPLGAWELIKVGLHYNPDDFTLLYQAGVTMQIIGDTSKSDEYLARAEQNYYINQRNLWSENIRKLRANNKVEEKKILVPGGNNGGKIIDFARTRKR